MLDPSFADRLDAGLGPDDVARANGYPGSALGRQPVHTVYVPADRFAEHTVAEWRAEALAALDQHGPLPGATVDEELVRVKLAAEPIEDLRIDFEDGYGNRPDDEEDQAARAAGTTLGHVTERPVTDRPEFTGIRMKSLEAATRRRGLR